MSTESQKNNDNQEIDLSQISKKIGQFFENLSAWIFRGFLFLKKNYITLGILFFIGAGIGIYLDKTTKAYDNQMIVIPNFETTEYLYSRIDLINSKINENDTVFLKEKVGIIDPKSLSKISVDPIIDIYRFINNSDKNFEFVKLLAEDGDIKKIVQENLTSKNYTYHIIKFSTTKKTSYETSVKPILDFINNSEYYKKVQNQYINNIKQEMVENDSLISQINGVLNSFSSAVNGSQRNDKLIYYNENTQLNDIIKTKEELINAQGRNRLSILNLDKIVKDSSSTINVKNVKSINGKLKLVLPFLFIFIFIFIRYFMLFYKKQMSKL